MTGLALLKRGVATPLLVGDPYNSFDTAERPALATTIHFHQS